MALSLEDSYKNIMEKTVCYVCGAKIEKPYDSAVMIVGPDKQKLLWGNVVCGSCWMTLRDAMDMMADQHNLFNELMEAQIG